MTEPQFAISDPASILIDILADFKTLTGKDILPSQPEYAIASCIAYHKSLALARVNEAGKAVLVDFATAPVLDYLAASFGIERLPAQGAVCTLQFTIVEGHLGQIIPLGTRISTVDGAAIFATTDDIVVPLGVNTVTGTAQCTTTGETGNNIEIGNVQTLLDPYAYIAGVTNTNITAGGADEETDANLRERVKLATAKFSVAGSRNAYIYWTKTANPLISDVRVLTYSEDDSILPGTVRIVCLLEGGELPTTDVNNEILAALSKETVRPLTDTVEVVTPTVKNYSLVIDVKRYANHPEGSMTATIFNAVNDYTTALKQKLGYDIINSKLAALCAIEGVYDATVTITPESGSLTGANYVIAQDSVGHCTGIEITITPTTND